MDEESVKLLNKQSMKIKIFVAICIIKKAILYKQIYLKYVLTTLEYF